MNRSRSRSALHGQPGCLRVQCAPGRGEAIQTELSEEFAHCFRNVARVHGDRWHQFLRACAPTALWVALSATIPILRDSTEEAIRVMHHVALAVTKVFLAYLKHTWYGLENAPLDRLYESVSSQLSKITKDASSYCYIPSFPHHTHHPAPMRSTGRLAPHRRSRRRHPPAAACVAPASPRASSAACPSLPVC